MSGLTRWEPTQRKEAYLNLRERAGSITIHFIFIVIISFFIGIGTAAAKIVVPIRAEIEVDVATLKAVVGAFDQAEEAIKAHDLEKVMALYSPQYNYHGLKKEDLRKIWKDLFDEYQEITSTHVFTKMAKVGSGRDAVVEVICTGHLWARSKTSGVDVPLDSWYEEVHYLILEGGTWRIRGNVGESPRVLPFGTAPHPLF